MKQTLLILLCILSGVGIPTVKAQFVPNGGFEEWEMRELYEEPENWNSGNMEAFMSNSQTAFITDDSYSGDYAVRLESLVAGSDTLLGYVSCKGSVTGGETDTLQFTGGLPISTIPDSIFGYFKYDIADDDTAIVLVSFKLDGKIISQNIFPITRDTSSYSKLGWQIESKGAACDTVLVGITCSHPFDPRPGSWVQADSLWFYAIGDSIPNTDFEVWEDLAYKEPVDHVTANLLTYLFGGDISADSTTDAHSGDYALSLTAVETNIPTDSGMTHAVVSFLMPDNPEQFFTDEISTFPVDFNPSQLTGYYKFTPFLNDTAVGMIYLIDDEENEYVHYVLLFPAVDYTSFTVDLNYPQGTTITQVGYIFSTTTLFGIGDGSGEIGSELILDDLELVNPCDTFAEFSINITEATCQENHNLLDAGAIWNGYLWSTDATTQTITVDDGTFSVTVTDNTKGCQFSDEVEVSTVICDIINDVKPESVSTSIYPNPSEGFFTIEFQNMLPGEYTIEIISITGKTLKRRNIQSTSDNQKIPFDLSSYPQGLYMVKIEGLKYSHYERILIE